MTRRLIETWLPIAALGIESLRERTPMTPFPAPNRLHVWWARRPLVASRAAILASLLPEHTDQGKFLHMLGIHGDPVRARRLMDGARRTGIRVQIRMGTRAPLVTCQAKRNCNGSLRKPGEWEKGHRLCLTRPPAAAVFRTKVPALA